MGDLVGGLCKISKNLINFDLIEIIQFCLEYLFVETPPPMGGFRDGPFF